MPNITRGGSTHGLMQYLVGDGRHNEHTDPHLVAGASHVMAWHGDAELDKAAAAQIARDLDEPMTVWGTAVEGGVYEWDEATRKRVKVGYGPKHVWHCSLSIKADEGQLSDDTWRQIATDFVERMGFVDGAKAPTPWVAVRHGLSGNGNDHIHIVVNLVREDGTKASTWGDFPKAQRITGELEREYGLEILESRAAGLARGSRGVSPAEQERQRSTGAPEPERITLARRVRGAAMTSSDEAEFVRRLRRLGVKVRPRFATGRDDVVVGYSAAVAPPAGERPIWFGGGQLGRDLALPRLRAYWPDTPEHASAATAEWQAAWRGQRVVAPGVEAQEPDASKWSEHVDRLKGLREQLRTVPVGDHATWSHVARQVSGTLAAWSNATEATPGPLADAADTLARYASTYQRPVRSKMPGRAGAQGVALMLTAMRPGTPDAVRAAIVVRQLMNTLKALHDAYQAIGHANSARQVEAVVRGRLATVHAGLASSAPVVQASTSTPALVSTLDPEAARALRIARTGSPAPGTPVPTKLEPYERPDRVRHGPTRGRDNDHGL